MKLNRSCTSGSIAQLVGLPRWRLTQPWRFGPSSLGNEGGGGSWLPPSHWCRRRNSGWLQHCRTGLLLWSHGKLVVPGWYRGTAPSDHQAGVPLLCNIPGVKPRGDFVPSAGKVTLHILLKWTFFVYISSRVPYWPVHSSTSLCPLVCPNPFTPRNCWDPWSQPLAKAQGEQPSA